MKSQEKYILTLERAHPYQHIHTYINVGHQQKKLFCTNIPFRRSLQTIKHYLPNDAF